MKNSFVTLIMDFRVFDEQTQINFCQIETYLRSSQYILVFNVENEEDFIQIYWTS